MPTYPNTNISKLQQATGILSSDLFDHAPGNPNAVRMSDFLTDAIGRDISGDYDTNSLTDGGGDLEPPWDTNLSVPNGEALNDRLAFGGNDGELNSDGTFKITQGDELSIGRRFWVRVNWTGGDFAFEQIIPDKLSLTTADNCKVTNRLRGTAPNGNQVIDFQIEVTGYDFLLLQFEYDDGGYNSHAINYNTTLQFFTDEVKTSTPFLSSITLRWASEQINSSYVACDGSTSLDQLALNPQGYGVKVNTTVSDPTGQNSDYHLWTYLEDSSASPPDPTFHDGTGGGSFQSYSKGKGACQNGPTGPQLSGNTFKMYVFITLDPAGTNIFESETISFTPSTGNEDTVTKTFQGP